MRFLALGDSYTSGEGVAEELCWPVQLTSLLRAREIDLDDPVIVARTAWTTDELSDAIDAASPCGPFDLVTLMVGVNDQYRSRDVRSFAGEYEKLLRRAIRFADDAATRVLAISIPDWGATPFSEGRDRALIGREIEAYNARGAELANQAGVRWVDVTTVTRAMLHDPTLVATDKLHPSGEMYRRWAELLAPLAMTALATRARGARGAS
ncbi:MAG TPA: SGNH/GDSL hydrolase family protein [Gemmatimonadaceae bacterium]|nr:SGNH/GDSL hydrolase family protein [Gemmatimonadaceae bacterium]